MSAEDTNQSRAQRVKIVEALTDGKCATVAISNTSVSLATALGEALNDLVGAVTVVGVGGTFYFNADGNDASASTGSRNVNGEKTFFGTKDELDNVRLYAGSSINVSIEQHVARR